MLFCFQSLMYQKLQKSQHRNKLANELMIYHMQVCSENMMVTITVDYIETDSEKKWLTQFLRYIKERYLIKINNMIQKMVREVGSSLHLRQFLKFREFCQFPHREVNVNVVTVSRTLSFLTGKLMSMWWLSVEHWGCI